MAAKLEAHQKPFDESIRDFGRQLLMKEEKTKKVRIALEMSDGRRFEYDSDNDVYKPLVEKRKKLNKITSEEWDG